MNVSDIFPAGFQQRAHSRGSPDNLGNSATKLGLPPTNNQQLKTQRELQRYAATLVNEFNFMDGN
jgi:hypothetical protein